LQHPPAAFLCEVVQVHANRLTCLAFKHAGENHMHSRLRFWLSLSLFCPSYPPRACQRTQSQVSGISSSPSYPQSAMRSSGSEPCSIDHSRAAALMSTASCVYRSGWRSPASYGGSSSTAVKPCLDVTLCPVTRAQSPQQTRT